jgi:hypothetical protein
MISQPTDHDAPRSAPRPTDHDRTAVAGKVAANCAASSGSDDFDLDPVAVDVSAIPTFPDRYRAEAEVGMLKELAKKVGVGKADKEQAPALPAERFEVLGKSLATNSGENLVSLSLFPCQPDLRRLHSHKLMELRVRDKIIDCVVDSPPSYQQSACINWISENLPAPRLIDAG